MSLRPVVAEQLDRLVRGELPELLTWVKQYGASGAVLVPQPHDIWTHRDASAVPTDDGGWHIVVPMWTEAESPSDLSAEIVVEPDGSAVIHDVHVL